jgi:hypothetical protein
MSTDRETTRIVRSWLHEDGHENADRVLDLVLEQIDTTPQRSASWLARRFPIMNNTVRIALTVAAVVVIALVGLTLLTPGSNIGGGPPESPTPTSIPDGTYETVVPVTEQASDDLGPCPCTWGFTLDGARFGLTGAGEVPTQVEFSGDQMTLPDWNRGIESDPSIRLRWVYDPETQAVTFSEMVGGNAGDRLVFERTWVKVD